MVETTELLLQDVSQEFAVAQGAELTYCYTEYPPPQQSPYPPQGGYQQLPPQGYPPQQGYGAPPQQYGAPPQGREYKLDETGPSLS